METLNTRDYLDFRDKLFPASGFQSAQMREIEILLGLGDDERVGLGEKGSWLEALETSTGGDSPALDRVRATHSRGSSLKQAVDDWLHRTPIRGSQPEAPGDEAIVGAFIDDYLAGVRR